VSSSPPEPPGDPIVGRVRALLDLAARHSLAELTIEAGDFKLSIRTRDHEPGPADPAAPLPPSADATLEAATEADDPVITAPMIGTFYAAPAPDEPPFVSVGDQIEPGQTIAIIEAMKIMNEIQSDQAGEVAEVLARDGQGVEFGQPLFRLRA
jgi:acetyl-CoA carboxylase biotin carboxyl carrier protein